MAEHSIAALSGAIDRAFSLNIAAILVIIAVYAATVLVSANTMDADLTVDAQHTAERWFTVGIGQPDDVAALIAGEPLSPTQWHDLEIADHVGGLTGYHIYNAEGHLLRSPSGTAQLSSANYRSRQELARRAIETGLIETQIEHVSNHSGNRHPEQETVFVNIFKPLTLPDGNIAVLMAQIDMSGQHAAAHAKFRQFILLASALAALALVFTTASTILLRRQRFNDRRIDQLLNYDVLTGIANRSHFVRRAPSLIANCARKKEQIAFYLIDLDHFKSLNDSIGHADGDVLLCVVARRLVAAAPGTFVARIGSDEFAILHPNVHGEAAARRQVQAILEAVRSIQVAAQPLIGVSVSVGFTVGSANQPLSDMMRDAEQALHAAKAAGRDQGVLFKHGMGENLRAATALRFKLHDLVRNKRLELFFQPLHRADGSLVSFEALVRLPDGNGGHLSNEHFVPIAEEMGLIGEIGDWVINEACRIAVGWPQHIGVSVNVSPQEFETGDVVARVCGALQRSGLAPRRLEVEITENLFITNTADVSVKLHALRTHGVGVVMDDFGTGYSSLEYLWKFPFDKLKIDRSCFMSLGLSDRVPVVLRTIRAMADAMHLRVTAEGIETEAQHVFAVAAGYDEMQGHYFSRPMPQQAVDAYISNCAQALAAAAQRGNDARAIPSPPERTSHG